LPRGARQSVRDSELFAAILRCMTKAEQTGRSFCSHESERKRALNGVRLAAFWQRLLGYFLDTVFAVMVWWPLELGFRHYVLHERQIEMKWDFHEAGNMVVMLLYWGLGNYLGNGQTPGK